MARAIQEKSRQPALVPCRRGGVVQESLDHTTPALRATPPPAEEGSLAPLPRLGLRSTLIRNLGSRSCAAVFCFHPAFINRSPLQGHEASYTFQIWGIAVRASS